MRCVYQGFITEESYGFFALSETENGNSYPLAASIQEDLEKLIGKPVSVRYFITKGIASEADATKELIKKISGVLEAEYELDAYSEWTILEWKENLSVGGHDLIEELSEYEGKYLVLIIETPPSPKGADEK